MNQSIDIGALLIEKGLQLPFIITTMACRTFHYREQVKNGNSQDISFSSRGSCASTQETIYKGIKAYSSSSAEISYFPQNSFLISYLRRVPDISTHEENSVCSPRHTS